jgi:F-type H+-transporting ATPase subunit b
MAGRALAAASCWLLIASHVAMAADEPPKQEGMPQLNFANPLTTAQVVWLAIIFAVLYFLLARWALPQVAEVLEFRAASIARDLDAARAAKAEADAATAELTAATRSAQAAAQAEIANAVDAAHKAAAAQAAELNARLEAQLAGAEARIDAARKAALGALREVATGTAQNVVDRLTGTSFDHATVAAAVNDVMATRTAA